ncbi:MAG: AmmeMemoRadiSam system protein B [Acidobacteriota bacterium]
MSDELEFPKLRPLEQVQVGVRRGMVALRDPTEMAEGLLTLAGPTIFVVSLMDGRHSRLDIQAEYMRRFGEMLFSQDLDELINRLDQARFLDGPSLRAHRETLAAQYRKADVRRLRGATLAPPDVDLDAYLDEMLGSVEPSTERIAGMIAPHLDYQRGAPCYAPAYRGLAERTDATRFVILGTNHFGNSTAVVGTRKDFETPWGAVAHDAEFMRALDARCDADLCEQELDHAREHSIELQVVLLKKVLGDRPFRIAPYLCPDLCGASETQPRSALRVGLRDFARALGDLLAEDPTPTCIVAGADLSHVGRFFGDRRALSEAYLDEVREFDQNVAAMIGTGEPERFRETIVSRDNWSRICGAGAIYVLATALLGRATPKLRRYHQAVTAEADNCVTCIAMDFVEREA